MSLGKMVCKINYLMKSIKICGQTWKVEHIQQYFIPFHALGTYMILSDSSIVFEVEKRLLLIPCCSFCGKQRFL